jgi:hypothetical protein
MAHVLKQFLQTVKAGTADAVDHAVTETPKNIIFGNVGSAPPQQMPDT